MHCKDLDSGLIKTLNPRLRYIIYSSTFLDSSLLGEQLKESGLKKESGLIRIMGLERIKGRMVKESSMKV